MLHIVFVTALALSIVCTLVSPDAPQSQVSQNSVRSVSVPSFMRRLQSSEEDANSLIDDFAVTHECKLGATNNQTCTTKGCCLCKSRSTVGCDCEAHYDSLASDAFDKCEEYMDGAQRKCKCTQDMETAKSVAKAAASAVLGSSMGSKIGYQVVASILYWLLFLRRNPLTNAPRKAWTTNAFVPNELKGGYNRGEWAMDPMGCCGDIVGSLMNFFMFSPRLATNWWAIGLVTTNNPDHAWFFSLAQALLLFPCMPILITMRRAKFREMFQMPADFATDLCCSVCCPFLIICQEARMIDATHGLQTGCCSMKKYEAKSLGPCLMTVNGKSTPAANAQWNSYFVGKDLKGRLVMDMGNLHGETDFSIKADDQVMMISQGAGVTFGQKTKRAAAAGAKAVIIFAEESGKKIDMLTNDPNTPCPSCPAFFVTKEVGDELIGLVTGGGAEIDFRIGLDIIDSLHWQQALQAIDGNTGIMNKEFGGVLEPGMQMCAGGTLEGSTLEEALANIKVTQTWPHTILFGPKGCNTDAPGQLKMAS